MNRTMLTATNTLAQLQKQMDIISNNIANVDTTGYKRKESQFTDLLVQQVNNQPIEQNEIGRLTPNGIRQGNGAKLAQSKIVMSLGAIKSTSRTLDTAFTKEGQLYKVLVQDGNESNINYTRNGALYLSPVGEDEVMLVNGDGFPVLDENDNPITITGDVKEYTVTGNGQLVANMTNGRVQTYNLGVVQVNKPQFLEQKGNNLFGLPYNYAELDATVEDILTELNGPLREQIGIQGSALEQSNVDLSKEMTDLINVQRAYQFQSRSVTLADQMLGLVNGIR
ncbi:flagellar hook-basal body protein [Bacillus massilinigeriensis]|uniref:flagellar hook-basal body protein n=1 Tax=Bacillus massilionigeriensis TaxID=1805475 RepID=UPI00096AE94D|nr:flagellar hook-basal body protein [Bacillus massilionigeriensis]